MKKNDDAKFMEIARRANVAGLAAGEAVVPIPMIVACPGERHFVADGVCGFAWIKFPGNTPFGRFALRTGLADKAWPSGLSIWVHEFNQSMARKEAYARAFAATLRENGIAATAGSRMD